MTYQETLAWMFAQLPMYQQVGKSALIAKLDNIQALAAHLAEPHTKFRSIHIAGTNGKGSSSHMLASILQEAGYTVGLYTSPHLKDFRERIRINGETVDQQFVIDFIDQNRPFLESHRLSFFEMTVGMAFEYFAKKKVDIAVVEVGLGGRLDSTNIIIPEVSLITNIGMDHTEILGDTLLKITAEKAGIIKAGVPVVISEYQEEIAPLFIQIASERNAPIVFAAKEIQSDHTTELPGNYQPRNVKGVIATLQQLKRFKVSEAHIRNGLSRVVANTGLMGRWQVLQKNPKVICDTAHNSEGLAIVVEQLLQQDHKRLHLVLGFVKEKNLAGILPLFPVDAHYYFCRPDIPRGLDATILQQHAAEFMLNGKAYLSVQDALSAALQAAGPDDIIFVGGSTFTVAEVV